MNRLKDKYADLLLAGLYRDTEGFENDNPKVSTRCFVNGKRMAIVATQSSEKAAVARIRVPGHSYVESDGVGEVKVDAGPDGSRSVHVGRDGLVVLIYEAVRQ